MKKSILFASLFIVSLSLAVCAQSGAKTRRTSIRQYFMNVPFEVFEYHAAARRKMLKTASIKGDLLKFTLPKSLYDADFKSLGTRKIAGEMKVFRRRTGGSLLGFGLTIYTKTVQPTSILDLYAFRDKKWTRVLDEFLPGMSEEQLLKSVSGKRSIKNKPATASSMPIIYHYQPNGVNVRYADCAAPTNCKNYKLIRAYRWNGRKFIKTR